MTEKAKQLGPRAILCGYIYVKNDQINQCLLGPSYAISILLNKNKLTMREIDVVEMYDGFSASVSANMKGMDSHYFNENYTAKMGA